MTGPAYVAQADNFVFKGFPYSMWKADDTLVTNKSRKRIRVHKSGLVQYRKDGGLWANSLLRKDEWEELDEAVVEAAGPRTERIMQLPQRSLGGIGTLISQWNRSTQMSPARVSISGRGTGERDRVEYLLSSVPVPVIWKEFEIGLRELEASRRLGDGLDVTGAYEASRVVAEKEVSMYYLGETSVNLNGNSIPGITTEANVNTGTADGDFGDISFIHSTLIGMIQDAHADFYFGPYVVEVATAQYLEMLARYSDGSGMNALQSVLEIPDIEAVYPSDQMTAGTLALVQNTPNVADWAEAMPITLVEWETGDGMTLEFRVMAIATPRVKSDAEGRSGIVYYTGA